MFVTSSLKLRLSNVTELKSIPLFKWSSLHSYFCYKFGIAGNSRLQSEVWDDLFNVLLFLRLNKTNNLALSTQLEIYLSTIHIPKGVQQMFHFLPVSGSFYNFKGIPLKIGLDDEIISFVESRAKSNELYTNLSSLSRQLKGSKAGRFERFDLIKFNSQVRNFLLNSIFIGNEQSHLKNYRLSLNTTEAILSKSIAISLVFSLNIASRCADAFLYVIGSLCEATIEKDALVVNVQAALELLLHEDSDTSKSGSGKVSSNGDSPSSDSTGSEMFGGDTKLQISSIKFSKLLDAIATQINNTNSILRVLSKSDDGIGVKT